MLKHGINLLTRHPRKPFQKLLDRGTPFQVFEQGGNWNASRAKNPSAVKPANVKHSIPRAAASKRVFGWGVARRPAGYTAVEPSR